MNQEKAKLFMSIIFSSSSDPEAVLSELVKHYGLIDYRSDTILFNNTDYYYPEMGKPLYRLIVSFEKIIDTGLLASVKLHTCCLEKNYLEGGNRTVNIDPGYITHAKVVLASTKNFFHRIYIGQGIFAELTLAWQKKEYRTFSWTYPDYGSDKYRDILSVIRGKFCADIKTENDTLRKKDKNSGHS